MVRQILARDLAKRLANGQTVQLIDVRQAWENALVALPDSQLIPLNELPRRASEIPQNGERAVVVYCHHGVRSLSAAAFLEKLGFGDVWSLAGGIDAWSCEVDPTLTRY